MGRRRAGFVQRAGLHSQGHVDGGIQETRGRARDPEASSQIGESSMSQSE